MNDHTFDWSAGYPSIRMPVFARNVVASSHPLASQAGLAMMRDGGNAIDAVIATAAVMTIVEPCSNGLGSDAFCILWDGEAMHGLNASGQAPAAWTLDYFLRKYGKSATAPPLRGWDSVTVPGAVAGWIALSKRFGKLSFDRLLAPAIEIAERGFSVPVIVRHKWAAAAPLLCNEPGWAETFMPRGRPPEVAELFKFPSAARALRAIARTSGKALYGGEIAEAAATHAAANGGAMTAADFAAFSPEWVDPIRTSAFGFDVHEMPPNGQGIAALVALGILRHTDVASLPVDGAASQHLQIEAMKLAFADTYAHVADPRAMRLTTAQMLDDVYLAARAAKINPKRAQVFETGHARRGGTVYLTAADEQGMMVSFIQSNCMGFGSGVVVPRWGLSLHNRGHFFSLDPASVTASRLGGAPFTRSSRASYRRMAPP